MKLSDGSSIIEGIPILFAVSFNGNAYVIEIPKERENMFDGAYMGEQFEEFPEDLAPGIYRGTFSYEFQMGYFEGYPAPGESSVYLTLEKYEKVKV